MDFRKVFTVGVAILAICALSVPAVFAQAVPGGTLDPTTIPKYVTPLVIPPVMNDATGTNTTSDYDIAVRQFQQQILPGGLWDVLGGTAFGFPATTVWSYGPAADPLPDISGVIPTIPAGIAPAPAAQSQFNYPAFTVENTVNVTTTVDWINDLKANFGTGAFLPYLIPGVVDQTLHWANPGADCISGAIRTDCRGQSQVPYVGPNPIITHVHGAHVNPESDGYPEAWYLPDPTGSNFTTTTDPALADPINGVYVSQGTLANGYGAPNTNVTAGVANFSYPNDQPSTTLWYHDHALGMTRLNVYAGPAGYWLIREAGGGETGLSFGTLPGPAPIAGEDPNFVPADRVKIREIPIVIQDRSFNADGSLFYPANRAFFEGLGTGQVASTPGNIAAGLDIPFIPGDLRGPSDIAPIWNPEAFFNVMVVNGVSWPELEVAPALYRFRLLNGCNSRFLNLALKKGGNGNAEIPFYQIGAEQSVLPQVVRIETGFATPLLGDGRDVCSGKSGRKGNKKNCISPVPGPFADQALLMGLAERADVIVDFRGLADGDIVRMRNSAPDAPFGGFPDIPADPATSGQIMQFRVNSALLGASPTDPVLANGVTPNPNAATDPWNVMLSAVENVDTYPGTLSSVTRDMALLEEESEDVCVSVSPAGAITYIDLGGVPFDPVDPTNACFVAGGVPFAPKAAVLGINGSLGPIAPSGQPGSTVTLWSDPIATNPDLDDTETWELWNWSADAHPIHLHLVKFKVVDRQVIGAATPIPPEADETGWKDTVIAYPGEVTRVAATFDLEGLYVWHCHIVEHEDNEMMVPYCVGDPNANGCAGL